MRRRIFLLALSLSLPSIAVALEPGPADTPTPAPSAAKQSNRETEDTTSDGMPLPNESSQTAEAERVMVTGSYIPTQTAAEVGPNPVQIIDRETIEKSGERNTEELLRNQPVANANGVPTSGSPGAIYGQGASSISLRGFDPGATLVLIDGHRMVTHPSGTNGGTQFFVDLNTIPRAGIQGVEILKDGASTTYGADAVAGVVNIKLRRDYRGAEVNVEYGNSTDTDSGEFASSVLFGLGDQTTNLTGVVNFYSRNSIFNRDRDYDRRTPLSRTTTNSEPYNLQLSRAAVVAAGGNPDPAVGDTFFAHAPFFTNGNAAASSYVYTQDPEATFPINHFQGELPDTHRYGVFLSADHKIFGDQVVLYTDLFLQHTAVHNEQAPTNTTSFQLQGATTIAIPPHAPGATLGGPTYAETGVPSGAYNPFNPFQQIIAGDSRARLFEFGNRQYDNDTDAFFTTVGFRGDKLFGGNWGYDAGFRYSRIDAEINFTVPSSTRFDRVLNAADPIFDPASPQFIGTTVPFNPFGDFHRIIPNNYRLADFVVVHPREVDSGTLATFDLNIYTTSLVELPAGGVGLAFGMQSQNETLFANIDQRLKAGDIRPFGILTPVNGDRDSYAGYAETSIPVFGGKAALPGFHALDLTAAVRYESFSSGSNVMVPKVGARWQPFDNSLTLRVTWGEGYRLPTLVELNAPPFAAAQSVFDPVKKQFVNDVPTTFLANPDLQPEDSRNFTCGIVYSPKFVPGLTASIDLFDIETTGWVNPFPDPTRTITRIESGNAFPGESVVRDANGNLVSITQVTFENTGTQKARGADFGLSYEFHTSAGTFRSTTLATFLDSFQFSPFPGEKEQELRSSPVDQFSDDAYLKWKGTSRFEWIWNGLETAVTAHYLDGFHEFEVQGNKHWVKQTWLFDLQASYDFGQMARIERGVGSGDPKDVPGSVKADFDTARLLKNLILTIGCNNIFNHDPPRSNDNFPRFIYDPTGRFVYVAVRKIF